jgi:hypothetical protein
MSSSISLHHPVTQEEQETVDAVLALQLYRAPSPAATTTDCVMLLGHVTHMDL